ncbi:hypothetical protein V4R08_08315 [Nitrobacter sp. NHB1]|uniref:hypothetical protein n=1 Tax=Nitrobacter sp. NHB1 TaxID=3119830 RepID=UPI002FFFD07D
MDGETGSQIFTPLARSLWQNLNDAIGLPHQIGAVDKPHHAACKGYHSKAITFSQIAFLELLRYPVVVSGLPAAHFRLIFNYET